MSSQYQCHLYSWNLEYLVPLFMLKTGNKKAACYFHIISATPTCSSFLPVASLDLPCPSAHLLPLQSLDLQYKYQPFLCFSGLALCIFGLAFQKIMLSFVLLFSLCCDQPGASFMVDSSFFLPALLVFIKFTLSCLFQFYRLFFNPTYSY